MTQQEPLVQLGVFDEFLGSTSVLMIGNREAFAALASSLRRVELRSNEAGVDNLLGIRIAQPNLVFTVSGAEEGCYVSEKQQGSYRWFIAPTAKLEVIEHFMSLATSTRPCHQYLESTGEIQIIASVDEYRASIFSEH